MRNRPVINHPQRLSLRLLRLTRRRLGLMPLILLPLRLRCRPTPNLSTWKRLHQLGQRHLPLRQLPPPSIEVEYLILEWHQHLRQHLRQHRPQREPVQLLLPLL